MFSYFLCYIQTTSVKSQSFQFCTIYQWTQSITLWLDFYIWTHAESEPEPEPLVIR